MEEDLLPRDDPSAVLLHEARPTPPTGCFNLLHHAFLRVCNELCSMVAIDAATLFALVASIGNLLQGWDNANIAGAMFYIDDEFHLEREPMIEGLIMAMALIGASISTGLSGLLADPFGRRILLLASSILSITSDLFIIFLSQKIYMIIIVRFISGLSIGLAVTHVPLYISEIAPAEIRGKLNTFPQLSGSVGMLISYCVVFWMSLMPKVGWRIMVGIKLIPSLIYTILIIFYLPESPRWLVSRGSVDEAKIVLWRIQRTQDISGEMANLLEGTCIGHTPTKEEFIIGPSDEPMKDKLVLSEEKVKLYELHKKLPCIAYPVNSENAHKSVVGSSFFDPIVILTEGVTEGVHVHEVDNTFIENQCVSSFDEENQYAFKEEEALNIEEKEREEDDGGDFTNNMPSGLYIGGGWQQAWKVGEEEGSNGQVQSAIERVYLHEECKGPKIDDSLSNKFIKVTALVNRSVFPQDQLGSHSFDYHSIEANSQRQKLSYLFEPGVRRALKLGIAIQVLQQFAGINGILYYTPKILEQVGVGGFLSQFDLNSSSTSILLSAITTLVMIPCIGVAVRLVDTKGRKNILLSTIPILLLSLTILVAANIMNMSTNLHAITSTLCVIVYQCVFVMGFGPIPNILCAEIFPTRVRAICLVICSLAFWICDTIVTYTFPVLMEVIGLAGVFGIFATVCALALLFVYFKVPETGGIPLEVLSKCFASTNISSKDDSKEDK